MATTTTKQVQAFCVFIVCLNSFCHFLTSGHNSDRILRNCVDHWLRQFETTEFSCCTRRSSTHPKGSCGDEFSYVCPYKIIWSWFVIFYDYELIVKNIGLHAINIVLYLVTLLCYCSCNAISFIICSLSNKINKFSIKVCKITN